MSIININPELILKQGLDLKQGVMLKALNDLKFTANYRVIDEHLYFSIDREKFCEQNKLFCDNPKMLYRYIKQFQAKQYLVHFKVQGVDYIRVTAQTI